jgi:hypothetical protein
MRSRTVKLESIIVSCQKSINELVPLLLDPVEGAIQRRCITRKIISLAEALTFIKNNQDQTNLSLNAIKDLPSESDPNKRMLDELNSHRNKLAHHYIAEHLLGVEKRFDDAVRSYGANLNKLAVAIGDFNKPPSSSESSSSSASSSQIDEENPVEIKPADNIKPATITKDIGITPEDKSGLTVLDYAHLILLETKELESILSEFNTDINDKNALQQFFSGSDYKSNIFLKEATLNCVENILILYKNFNDRYYSEEQKSKREYHASVYALESLMKKENKSYLFKFIDVAPKLRRDSIHNFEGLLDDSNLKIYIIKIAALKNLYFQKSIECFKASEIQCDPRYSNLLSPSVPAVSSSAEKRPEVSSVENESKPLPFKPKPLGLKRSSADLSSDLNKKLKEGESTEEASSSEISHEQRLQNVMERNPSLTGHPTSNPQRENVHSSTSSSEESGQDVKQKEGDEAPSDPSTRPRM